MNSFQSLQNTFKVLLPWTLSTLLDALWVLKMSDLNPSPFPLFFRLTAKQYVFWGHWSTGFPNFQPIKVHSTVWVLELKKDNFKIIIKQYMQKIRT